MGSSYTELLGTRRARKTSTTLFAKWVLAYLLCLNDCNSMQHLTFEQETVKNRHTFFGQVSQNTVDKRLGKILLYTSHHPEGNEISMRIVQWKPWLGKRKNLSFKACKVSSLLKFSTLSEYRPKEESNRVLWLHNFYKSLQSSPLLFTLQRQSMALQNIKEAVWKCKIWEPITRQW